MGLHLLDSSSDFKIHFTCEPHKLAGGGGGGGKLTYEQCLSKVHFVAGQA